MCLVSVWVVCGFMLVVENRLVSMVGVVVLRLILLFLLIIVICIVVGL